MKTVRFDDIEIATIDWQIGCRAYYDADGNRVVPQTTEFYPGPRPTHAAPQDGPNDAADFGIPR